MKSLILVYNEDIIKTLRKYHYRLPLQYSYKKFDYDQMLKDLKSIDIKLLEERGYMKKPIETYSHNLIIFGIKKYERISELIKEYRRIYNILYKASRFYGIRKDVKLVVSILELIYDKYGDLIFKGLGIDIRYPYLMRYISKKELVYIDYIYLKEHKAYPFYGKRSLYDVSRIKYKLIKPIMNLNRFMLKYFK